MDIIQKNAAFFNSLYDIQRIIVIGHSMAEVDMPYFEEITKHINKDCIGHFIGMPQMNKVGFIN